MYGYILLAIFSYCVGRIYQHKRNDKYIKDLCEINLNLIKKIVDYEQVKKLEAHLSEKKVNNI